MCNLDFPEAEMPCAGCFLELRRKNLQNLFMCRCIKTMFCPKGQKFLLGRHMWTQHGILVKDPKSPSYRKLYFTVHCLSSYSHVQSKEHILFSTPPLLLFAGCMCGWTSLRMLDLIRGEFGSIDYQLLENQIKYKGKVKLKMQSKLYRACFPPYPSTWYLHKSVLAHAIYLSLWSSL